MCVTAEGGVIVRLEAAQEDTDLYLAPGLVDLQVNGSAGYDLNVDGLTAESVATLAAEMLRGGVTCFAPTLITAAEEDLTARVKAVAEACRVDRRVAACVPFIHMEGPHISPLDGYRGAHSAQHVRPPSIAEFERWQESADGLVGMVTLSPHFPESCHYVEELVKRGVHVSIGHTHASAQQIREAVDAGARLSTHLGNGLPAQIPRHGNPIWSQLADDRLTAMFIADGNHLPAEALKAMLKAKGTDRSILVSDSVALAGKPAGVYDSPIGGRVELKPDGRLCIFGSELLAGSVTPLMRCVGRAVQMTGITLGDALAMATAIPGHFAGGRGTLALGARADLVRFRLNGEMVLHDVWLGGECVFQREA